ncbi:MAG: murein biosynthesis integral membrane protein MurJ [Candidatus Zixiibacteriota bacterium]
MTSTDTTTKTQATSRFARQTGTVAGATVISRVFGLVREQVIAYMFGAGALTDVFVAAFRIPNLLRDLFAEGAFSAAFIPSFTGVLTKEGRQAAFDLLNRVLSVFVPAIGLICLLGIIFTPQLAQLISGGVEQTPGKLELLIVMARWMFPFLLLVSLAAAFMGALNAMGQFGIPALAPAGFNVGVILGAVWLSRYSDPPLLALAWGVLLGGALQWGIQIVLAHQLGFRFGVRSGWRDSEVGKILKLMLPALIGIAAIQVNVFAITRFAWTLGDGPVAYLNFAFRILFLPLGVFAVAAATVGLPRLSGYVAAGDNEAVRDTYTQGVRTVLYLVVPTAVGLIVLAEPICGALFQRGRFTASDTSATALALQYYSLGLPTMALIRVTAPLFYAHQDTRTPALCGVVAVAANLIGMSLLVGPMGFGGLALSVAISSVIQITLLWIVATHRYGSVGVLSHLIEWIKLAGLSLVCVAAGWWAMNHISVLPTGMGLIIKAGTGILVAAVLYLGITWMFGYRNLGGARRVTTSGGEQTK